MLSPSLHNISAKRMWNPSTATFFKIFSLSSPAVLTCKKCYLKKLCDIYIKQEYAKLTLACVTTPGEKVNFFLSLSAEAEAYLYLCAVAWKSNLTEELCQEAGALYFKLHPTSITFLSADFLKVWCQCSSMNSACIQAANMKLWSYTVKTAWDNEFHNTTHNTPYTHKPAKQSPVQRNWFNFGSFSILFVFSEKWVKSIHLATHFLKVFNPFQGYVAAGAYPSHY